MTVSLSARKLTVTTMEPVWRARRTASSVAVLSALRGNSVRLTLMTARTIPARARLHTATILSTTMSASVRLAWRGNPVSLILTSVLPSPANTGLARIRSETISVNATRDTPGETAPRTLTTVSCYPVSTADPARTWSTTTAAPASRDTRAGTARWTSTSARGKFLLIL